MTTNALNTTRLRRFLESAGIPDMPMGLFYTGRKPESGICPRRQTRLSRLEPGTGELNWQGCVLGKISRARRKNCAAYFDQDHYGCLGGAFIMGFKPGYEPFEPALISTGIPGKIPGERYADSPETGKTLYENFQPPAASGAVMVVQPLDRFKGGQRPEIVILFPTRGSLIALNALTLFITGDPDAVAMPFGMACSTVISWPRKFAGQGTAKAVIGGFDLNCIRYLKPGEFTYAVSFDLFLKMLEVWPQSMMGTRAWQRLERKVRQEIQGAAAP